MWQAITPYCVQFDRETHSTASAVVQSTNSVMCISLPNETHKYILTKNIRMRAIWLERILVVLGECSANPFGCAVQ